MMDRRGFLGALFGALAAAPVLPEVAAKLPELSLLSDWFRFRINVGKTGADLWIGTAGEPLTEIIRVALPEGYQSFPFCLGADCRMYDVSSFEEVARRILSSFRIVEQGRFYALCIQPGTGVASFDDIIFAATTLPDDFVQEMNNAEGVAVEHGSGEGSSGAVA